MFVRCMKRRNYIFDDVLTVSITLYKCAKVLKVPYKVRPCDEELDQLIIISKF